MFEFTYKSPMTANTIRSLALNLLKDWDAERNAEVKTQASVQFHTLIDGQSDDVHDAVAKLEKLLPCYGPDHNERRQAAAAGLIVLQRLQVVLKRLETIGFTGQQVNIPISDGSRQNRVFLSILGNHWSYVKEVLKDKIEILTNRVGPKRLWEQLAIIAPEYPLLTREILELADSDLTLRREANVLKLLARSEPKSERLASICLLVLADQSNWYGWFDSADAAAGILADHFRGDSAIEQRLVALASEESVPTGVTLALALGWQKNILLRQLQFDNRRQKISAAELYVKYATCSPFVLASILEADFVLAQYNPFQIKMIIRPLVARLQNDSDAFRELSDALFETTNPSMKASVSSLLASGKIDSRRDRWCREELERQMAMRSPEVGYDLLTDSPQAVSLCLLESIGETSPEDSITIDDATI
jgi:hypothetical protein